MMDACSGLQEKVLVFLPGSKLMRRQVVRCARGRGTQMNAGARRARGDLLLFLHADAELPEGYWDEVADAWNAAAVHGKPR